MSKEPGKVTKALMRFHEQTKPAPATTGKEGDASCGIQPRLTPTSQGKAAPTFKPKAQPAPATGEKQINIPVECRKCGEVFTVKFPKPVPATGPTDFVPFLGPYGSPPKPAPATACENTDRELWREREGDYYADSIHVTKDGGIGINCGGSVYVKSLREWHRLAKRPPATGEWFGSIGGLITDKSGKPIGNALNIDAAKVISDAHNAALAAVQRIADDSIIENVRLMNVLAAEREKLERVNRELERSVAVEGAMNRTNTELREQLAAEREAKIREGKCTCDSHKTCPIHNPLTDNVSREGK